MPFNSDLCFVLGLHVMLIVSPLQWDLPKKTFSQTFSVEAILCAVQVTIATVGLKITDLNLSVESSCS